MNQFSSPLVSICMAAYNVKRFLPEALSSILNQTYPNIEVIVVDDGSTDGTSDVIRSITDPRVRPYHHAPNIGGYQAMNKAVSFARGDYIAVYHSDDMYDPTIVEQEVAYFESHPQVGAVFTLDYYMDDDGVVFGKMTLPRQFRACEVLTYSDVFPFLLRRKNILFCCPTFMTRRAVWEQVGPFDADTFDIVSDLEMWIRILHQFPVAILNQHLIRYRRRKANWSARYNRLRVEPEGYFKVMDHYIEADHWREKLPAKEWIEYAYQRCDDETTRAANYIILNDVPSAENLLRNPFPWRTFLIEIRRRKVRVLLLRSLMRLFLALGIVRLLKPMLIWMEYKGKMQAPTKTNTI